MTIEMSLDKFTTEVMLSFGERDLNLEIVDERGSHPIVTALDSEQLGVVMRRIMMFSNGYANLFVHGNKGVRQVSFIPANSALYEQDAEDMVQDPPSSIVTIGAFLDYLEAKPTGVTIPALLPIPTGAFASNVREVSLT